jgi:hypothetical protein
MNELREARASRARAILYGLLVCSGILAALLVGGAMGLRLVRLILGTGPQTFLILLTGTTVGLLALSLIDIGAIWPPYRQWRQKRWLAFPLAGMVGLGIAIGGAWIALLKTGVLAPGYGLAMVALLLGWAALMDRKEQRKKRNQSEV